eukprot:6199128-Pleurochrysis_carterae.AAC.3
MFGSSNKAEVSADERHIWRTDESADECVDWKEVGTPSAREVGLDEALNVLNLLELDTPIESAAMSTFSRFDTGASSSKFQRCARAATEKVVNITTINEALFDVIDGLLDGARCIGRTDIVYTPILSAKRKENAAISAVPSLRHALSLFVDAANAGPSVGAIGCVPQRRIALALRVGRHKVPFVHARAGSDGGQYANKQAWVSSSAERLVRIDALHLRTNLNAPPGFEGDAARAIVVDQNQPGDGAAQRDRCRCCNDS